MSAKSTRLTDKARRTLAAVFEHVLAEESHLASTTHRYVWRVRGSPVQSLKRLFAEQGRQIDRWVGELVNQARRAGIAPRSAPEQVDVDVPLDSPSEVPPPAEGAMIGELLVLHEHMASQLRTDVAVLEERDSDPGAARLLTGLLEFHETTAWMLRLLLETRSHRL